jgi:alpha-N-acetylglucosaminidase
MYNVCTYGYSLPWWNATVWQQEIDRLAMWGINLPLAFIGQEYITMQFLKGEGLSDQQVQEWMSGPAFLPWFRMNNMYAWGGPIGDNWIQVQHDLQLQVVAMMRDFGMTPVLPGFAGHFPASILTVLPNLNLTQNSNWAGFNSSYSANFLLEPTDPNYVPLGINYTRILLQEYGNPDEIPFLNSDTYNEMDPSSGDLTFLEESNAAVYQAMTGADERSYVHTHTCIHSSLRVTAGTSSCILPQ